MRVIVREDAYRDLDNIHAWIAKDRPTAADRVIERIIQSTELLGHVPYIGHAGKARGTLEWVVRGLPYIVVYTVDREADELTVDRRVPRRAKPIGLLCRPHPSRLARHSLPQCGA